MAMETPQIQGLNAVQQARYDDYHAKLRTLEPGSLANELAIIFVLVPLIPVDRVIKQATENTRIIRHNRKVTLNRKKAEELQSLLDKKRLSPADNARANKLARDLNLLEDL